MKQSEYVAVQDLTRLRIAVWLLERVHGALPGVVSWDDWEVVVRATRALEDELMSKFGIEWKQ